MVYLVFLPYQWLYIYCGLTALSFALQSAIELFQCIGFREVTLIYTLSDLLYFLMLYSVVMMNIMITKQEGSFLHRFGVQPFSAFILL